MVALSGVLGAAVREVEPPEEQRPVWQFPQLLGLAAQPVPERFCVGTRGGDVLTGDDVVLGPVDHGVEGGTAGVVVSAFLGEGVVEEGGEVGGVVEDGFG